MWKKSILVLVAFVISPHLGYGQETKAVLDGASKAMGDVNSLRYSGSGAFFAFGQSFTPGDPWPRFGLKSYTRTIDYETPALRDEVVRAEGDPVARGGGLPIPGGQRLTTAVSGTLAWGQLAEGPVNPAPAAVGDRLHQLWITPHGLIKAALKYNATVQTQEGGGKKTSTISFAVPGQFKVRAVVNDKNLIEKVESWNTNPVLGDMPTETVYADYKDFGGVQFPTKITQKQGGFPTLDLTINEVTPNAPANIQPPDNVRQAGIKVQAEKVADGVWYLTGGTHHSVLVEMSDHLVVIEGPLDDARADAVIAAVKNLVPNKPIKHVVNSHHHFDHAGGLGAFAADGATIITDDSTKAFLEQSLAAPRSIHPDKLAQSGKKATVEGMPDKRVLSDATVLTSACSHARPRARARLISGKLSKARLRLNARSRPRRRLPDSRFGLRNAAAAVLPGKVQQPRRRPDKNRTRLAVVTAVRIP